MPDRLGRNAPPTMLEGWSRLMEPTPLSTQLGVIVQVPKLDVRSALAPGGGAAATLDFIARRAAC